MKKIKEKKNHSLHKNGLELIVVGGVTGVFAGLVVTVYNLLMHNAESLARDWYATVRANPAWLPVLLLTLALGAFFVGVLVQISSVVRGCGIPQAEGATRGIVPLKWFRDMTAMFAASITSVLMGLSIGAEGPSVLIGACAGDGVASTLKRDHLVRKYQATGGACAGLAVASNAPLTGMAFAFEEAYKRFTPEVFICSFSSVIFGILTRSAIYQALGMDLQSAFHSFVFQEMPLGDYLYAVGAGLACGLLGVGFYWLCFLMRALFRKIKMQKQSYTHILRIAAATFIGGTVSLLAAEVMGGGHELIESLGTLGGTAQPTTESVFGLPIVWTLTIVLILKSLVTAVNVGSGLPCGIFIPIIAIGACVGGILNRLWLALGMSATYCDLMTMICMAAFFTTIVRAPITAIVMICEFTGSFAPLLPVIIAVSIGYMIGELFHADGIYEALLEAYEHESGIHEQAVREVYEFTVAHGAMADRRALRDVLWPTGARVREIVRGDEHIFPHGDTVLRGGDVVTVVCTTSQREKVKEELAHILG